MIHVYTYCSTAGIVCIKKYRYISYKYITLIPTILYYPNLQQPMEIGCRSENIVFGATIRENTVLP